MFEFRVHRDCDGRSFRIRKVVIELFFEGKLVDRRRMFGLFGGAFFVKRLTRKMRNMLRQGKVMQSFTGEVK